DVAVEYATQLFDAGTIARLLGHFRILLEGIAADPERRLSDLPYLTAAERYDLLIGWQAARPIPIDACLHDLVAAQAERIPDAIAIVGDEAQISYAELLRRARDL